MKPELEKILKELVEKNTFHLDESLTATINPKLTASLWFEYGFQAASEHYEEKVRGLVEALENLIEDIKTPNSLGLAKPVNPEWVNFNKAQKALAEFEGE